MWRSYSERERDCYAEDLQRQADRVCRQMERTSYSTAWLSQGKSKRGGRRHKRRSWLVPIHQPSIFPLTHGTQMKTDFKGEDEKHSLLKAKCFTRGPCANTVVLSEKWTTVKLANRCASHTMHESYAVEYMEKAYTSLWPLCVPCASRKTQINTLPLKKIRIFRNIRGLLKDLTCKQYISLLVVKPNEPLLRTGSSLTMFITDLKKQLKSTRCWGRTGPGEAPPGRMRSGTRSSFWKLKATKGGGQQRFRYTCWALRNWTPNRGVGKRSTHCRLSKGAERLNLGVQCFNGSQSWMAQSVHDDVHRMGR